MKINGDFFFSINKWRINNLIVNDCVYSYIKDITLNILKVIKQ